MHTKHIQRFILFLSLPYNSLCLSTFCIFPSFFLRCFLFRSSFLLIHFHFLLSSCLLILLTTHVVLCFIPFLYCGTQHIQFAYRPSTIFTNYLTVTNTLFSCCSHDIFIPLQVTFTSADNAHVLSWSWELFVPSETLHRSACERCRMCRVGRQC
jgi:hypothetical protein